MTKSSKNKCRGTIGVTYVRSLNINPEVQHFEHTKNETKRKVENFREKKKKRRKKKEKNNEANAGGTVRRNGRASINGSYGR